LYRFLNDLSSYFNHPIIFDSDGRSPEQLFWDQHALANNRIPFCSRILKAQRLQNYYQDGDLIIFGIGIDERHRAGRLKNVYTGVSERKKKKVELKFPLLKENISSNQIDKFLLDTGIEEPLLYKLGFTHNNCSGGCVRAGKKQWKLLYEKLPKVYLDRERVEEEFRISFNKDVHFFKDETLKSFRYRIKSGSLSKYYNTNTESEEIKECIGICNLEN